ncbi:hypothetical protein ACTMU2_11615 [Cupriavidus basilensis]
MLPHVAAFANHTRGPRHGGGLALRAPLVCLPSETSVADQPALAAQVEVLGAGISLDGDDSHS